MFAKPYVQRLSRNATFHGKQSELRAHTAGVCFYGILYINSFFILLINYVYEFAKAGTVVIMSSYVTLCWNMFYVNGTQELFNNSLQCQFDYIFVSCHLQKYFDFSKYDQNRTLQHRVNVINEPPHIFFMYIYYT